MQHFTVRIESGEVKQLTCPEDKCDTQAHPSQVSLPLTWTTIVLELLLNPEGPSAFVHS